MNFDVGTIAAIFSTTGNTLVNLDENTTGADDFSGELLIYTGDVISAIKNAEDLPELPDIITKGVTDKISGAARVSLIMASAWLPFIQAASPAKYRTALKYLGQVLRQLLAGKPVPPMPAEIKAGLTPAKA